MHGTLSTWTKAALVVALGGPPLVAFVAGQWLGESPPLVALIGLQGIYCGLAVFVVWTVLRRERLPLASIGLIAPRWSTLLFAALLWGLAFWVLPPLTAPLREAAGGVPPDNLRRLLVLPLWFRVVLAVSGGVIEELLYRGYAVERLSELTQRRWLAAAIAAIAFGLAHVPAWGVRYALAADLPFGVVATLFYTWRRDLLANMLAHDAGLLISVLSLTP